MLQTWRQTAGADCEVVFSCSVDNDYGHPQPNLYSELMPMNADSTFDARGRGETYVDILFR